MSATTQELVDLPRSAAHKRSHRDAGKSIDSIMMRRALALARKAQGYVEPNPMVGCVICKNDRVVGEGYHRRFGGPHAEIEALRVCSESTRRATVYVTLEPCCHHGKTPPCVDALIAARVSRIVVALGDPNLYPQGSGIKQIRSAGIKVDVGTEAHKAAELNAPFLTRVRLGRPYVIAKWAQSIDGKLATAIGHSQWISCQASRRKVHQLRGRVDAIVVGSGTVKADDPSLTAREVRIRRHARRIVLDGRLRLPKQCELTDTALETLTSVVTTAAKAKTPKAEALRKLGVDIIRCPLRGGRLDLGACLGKLAASDVTNLVVEGGPTILTAFFEAGLVDEALVFVAPIFIGGKQAPSALGGVGAATVDQAIKSASLQIRRSGDDTLYRVRLTRPPL